MTADVNESNVTQFDLLRHGQIDGPPALYGRTDVALSRDGWEQMYRQTNLLHRFDNIISSPLRRCHDFAKELASGHQLKLQTEKQLTHSQGKLLLKADADTDEVETYTKQQEHELDRLADVCMAHLDWQKTHTFIADNEATK